MHTDTPGYLAPRREALRVLTDEHMTGNVQTLLHEIRYALVHLSELGETTVIDLRNFSQPYQSTQE
jgi:transcriptional regulator with AAA-type ATPase domain